jgi:hypothetical protein
MEQISTGFIIVVLLIIIFMVVSEWIIFTKAGKPGWATLVPIYNTIVLLEIVGKPWWWLFLLCIPIVNIVFLIIIYHRLSVAFGHEVGFTLGLIFLPIIFFPLLAFGDSKYLGPDGIPAPQQPPASL